MNDGRRKASEKLDNLINAIVEDILDAPDSETIQGLRDRACHGT